MIPTQVLDRIKHALATLRQIDAALEAGRDLDRRFGGEGRYEVEAWEALLTAHYWTRRNAA